MEGDWKLNAEIYNHWLWYQFSIWNNCTF